MCRALMVWKDSWNVYRGRDQISERSSSAVSTSFHQLPWSKASFQEDPMFGDAMCGDPRSVRKESRVARNKMSHILFCHKSTKETRSGQKPCTWRDCIWTICEIVAIFFKGVNGSVYNENIIIWIINLQFSVVVPLVTEAADHMTWLCFIGEKL